MDTYSGCGQAMDLREINMRQIGQCEPLAAMKALLRDLENTTLLYPDHADIVTLKRDLSMKIADADKTKVHKNRSGLNRVSHSG